MRKLKERFMNDPEFAVTVTLVTTAVVATLMTASAKLIGSSAYAVHASKRAPAK